MALERAGKMLSDKALPQDETLFRDVLTRLTDHEKVLVVDHPATIGALPVAVAQAAGVAVGYLPGLAMRRIPGQAKPDARDAAIIVLSLRCQRPDIAAQVEALAEAQPLYEVLTSMPGIGVRGSSRFVVNVLP